MSKKCVDRKNDEEIIDIINSILSKGNFIIETINEAVLVKLMDLRGTPIKYNKTFRDIENDYNNWKKYGNKI